MYHFAKFLFISLYSFETVNLQNTHKGKNSLDTQLVAWYVFPLDFIL